MPATARCSGGGGGSHFYHLLCAGEVDVLFSSPPAPLISQRNACATYNFLSEEGRLVGAALLVLPK